MSSPAYGSRLSDSATSDALRELALDLRWSFNHAADKIWERLDPELWELTPQSVGRLADYFQRKVAERYQ